MYDFWGGKSKITHSKSKTQKTYIKKNNTLSSALTRVKFRLTAELGRSSFSTIYTLQNEQNPSRQNPRPAAISDDGGCEQGAGRSHESREQQRRHRRLPGGRLRGPVREIGEPAAVHRVPRGREGHARQVEQGHEEGHVGLEAAAVRGSRLRFCSPSARQAQGHLRRGPCSATRYSPLPPSLSVY